MRKFLFTLFIFLSTFSAISAEEVLISDIKIEGLQRVEPGLVFSNLPFDVNDPLEEIDVSSTIKLLYKTGQFKDISLEQEGSKIIIIVNEKPIIAELNFYGVEAFQDDKLKIGLSQMNVASGLVFDKTDLKKVEQEIANQYLALGKYTASVKAEAIPLERNRMRVNIYVEEGTVSRIKEINIVGNRLYKKEDLLESFTLKVTNFLSWWNKDDRYSKQVLSGDLEKLRSFYMDRGYLDFKINSSLIRISENKKNVYIDISITEGNKYFIGDAKLSGKYENVPEALLQAQIVLRKGQVFNRAEVTATTNRLNQILGDYGYAFSNANAIPDVNKEERTVSFNFFVDPGNKIYVRRINFYGNEKTKDSVLRREMRQFEASWYAKHKVDRSQTRLSATQYFDSIDIQTTTVPGTTDQIDVNVQVVERNTGKLMLGAGISSGEGLVGTLTVSQSNFLGTGNTVSSSISTGEVNKTYALSYMDPYWTDDGIQRTVGAYRRDVNTNDLSTADYNTYSYGATVTFGIPLSEYNSVSISSTLDLTDIELGANASQEYIAFCQDVTSSTSTSGCNTDSLTVASAYARDTRNNAQFPTAGSYYHILGEISAPVFDMQFYKFVGKGERYWPISDDMSFKVKGSLGYADSYGDKKYPFFKNFFMGGPKNVRGYDQASIGEKTLNAVTSEQETTGGKKSLYGSAELFFPPPGLKNVKGFRLSTFVDGGGVFKNNIESSVMRYSAGIGALWLSPFGPLTISYAKPLNEGTNDSISELQFGMGGSF
ncbi:MAG: outer membrane protein assembly factor BamA [Methylophilaceae bacterium]